MNILIKTIVILFIPFVCYASPVLSTVNGPNISGSGFGTGDTTPILYDNFESGTNGEQLNANPQIGTWILNDTVPPNTLATYSNLYAHSGSLCSYATTTSASLSSQFGSPASGSMSDTYYYIYFWFRYDNYNTSGQVKLIQLWGTYQAAGGPGVYVGASGGIDGWYGDIFLEETLDTNVVWFTGPSLNTWHLCEMVLKQSDVNTANGIVKIYYDGVEKYSKTNVITRELEGESWLRHYFFYGYTNGTVEETKSTIIDDVYLNNSWSRVIIGNASTLAASTHREIQIPSSWSDTSISITVNQGSFSDGELVYLFVIDSDGNASEGYPVIISGGQLSPPPIQANNLTANNVTFGG